MKHLHYFLCIGLVATVLSCSKDDDDEDKTIPVTPNNVQNDSTQNQNNLTNADFDFYGAELYTLESFKYGRFEARMKMAYAPGCISSMFLYYNNSYEGNGKVWNEIDIEVIGKNSSAFQSNIITGELNAKVTSENIHNLTSPVDSEYHVYTIEWTPEKVTWLLDGEVQRETSVLSGTKAKEQVESLVESQSLRFNLWASSSVGWVGQFDQKNIPIAQYIDYVKVYDYDTETGTFTERWTDDFDSYNAKRWTRGNWNMDLVKESTTNVVVEDGNIVLKLTKKQKENTK